MDNQGLVTTSSEREANYVPKVNGGLLLHGIALVQAIEVEVAKDVDPARRLLGMAQLCHSGRVETSVVFVDVHEHCHLQLHHAHMR